MKQVLLFLRTLMILLFISSFISVANNMVSEAAGVNYDTANLDIINGVPVKMPRKSGGVIVDGYQLQHDYVKILNINNGAITINDEQYTQGTLTEP